MLSCALLKRNRCVSNKISRLKNRRKKCDIEVAPAISQIKHRICGSWLLILRHHPNSKHEFWSSSRFNCCKHGIGVLMSHSIIGNISASESLEHHAGKAYKNSNKNSQSHKTSSDCFVLVNSFVSEKLFWTEHIAWFDDRFCFTDDFHFLFSF